MISTQPVSIQAQASSTPSSSTAQTGTNGNLAQVTPANAPAPRGINQVPGPMEAIGRIGQAWGSVKDAQSFGKALTDTLVAIPLLGVLYTMGAIGKLTGGSNPQNNNAQS